MQRWLGKWSEHIFALLRVVAGAAFACHGAQKLFGVLGGHQNLHDPQILAAGIIEFVGGLLIAIGLFASPAAFLASGEMAVGYFQVHAPNGFWPIINKGELAVVYCFLFLYIAARGSGRFSIDAMIGRDHGKGTR
jgi:putative oxidoreductase